MTVWRGRDRLDRPATFRPDPGWDYNPGREWARWDSVGHLPDCVSTSDFATAVGITGMQRIITMPIEELAARRELLRHMVAKRNEKRERYARYVLPTLEDPFETWLTAYAGQGYRRRYIGLFTGGRGLAVVVRVNADGSLMWNILPASDKRINGLRVGALLYAKPGR